MSKRQARQVLLKSLPAPAGSGYIMRSYHSLQFATEVRMPEPPQIGKVVRQDLCQILNKENLLRRLGGRLKARLTRDGRRLEALF